MVIQYLLKQYCQQCGEENPSCMQCIRSGWKCPGYTNTWKFIDEHPRLAMDYSRRKYIYDESSNGEEDDENIRVLVWKAHTSKIPRYHGTNPLASALIYSLDSKTKGVLVPLRLAGSFFDFIPSRLGHNQALDDAVSCLCAIYSRISSTLYDFHKRVVLRYVQALSSLRICLNDALLQSKSETLCASILLQICEVSFACRTTRAIRRA